MNCLCLGWFDFGAQPSDVKGTAERIQEPKQYKVAVINMSNINVTRVKLKFIKPKITFDSSIFHKNIIHDWSVSFSNNKPCHYPHHNTQKDRVV